jgi:hypothetical protein
VTKKAITSGTDDAAVKLDDFGLDDLGTKLGQACLTRRPPSAVSTRLRRLQESLRACVAPIYSGAAFAMAGRT